MWSNIVHIFAKLPSVDIYLQAICRAFRSIDKWAGFLANLNRNGYVVTARNVKVERCAVKGNSCLLKSLCWSFTVFPALPCGSTPHVPIKHAINHISYRISSHLPSKEATLSRISTIGGARREGNLMFIFSGKCILLISSYVGSGC